MLSYALVGSNKLPEAKAFYGDVLGLLGMKKAFDHQSGGELYSKDGAIQFGVVGPYNGEPATVGNGTMVAFASPDRGTVDKFHSRVIELGGSCEGAPGFRGPEEYGFYAAYVRDPEGNKLAVINMAAPK